MQKDSEALAKANKFLNERFATTESEFVSDVYRIDGLDFGEFDGLFRFFPIFGRLFPLTENEAKRFPHVCHFRP
ncbi:hypothetical protein BMJ20_33550 [Sinorhizobium medicae]|nr:hypothetical protein BMJ31_17505 [Sinorhizobium medicae]PLU30764.1 hypothetical protein BMJ28_23745 [Sinorhizobium medicae]PLU58044.1 hypothetical protein BMJ24_17145 [Sinorhizobium medicae]PLU65104.1 hypothetical protein BMJ20_33550 [Sinorhizobium medicae]